MRIVCDSELRHNLWVNPLVGWAYDDESAVGVYRNSMGLHCFELSAPMRTLDAVKPKVFGAEKCSGFTEAHETYGARVPKNVELSEMSTPQYMPLRPCSDALFRAVSYGRFEEKAASAPLGCSGLRTREVARARASNKEFMERLLDNLDVITDMTRSTFSAETPTVAELTRNTELFYSFCRGSRGATAGIPDGRLTLTVGSDKLDEREWFVLFSPDGLNTRCSLHFLQRVGRDDDWGGPLSQLVNDAGLSCQYEDALRVRGSTGQFQYELRGELRETREGMLFLGDLIRRLWLTLVPSKRPVAVCPAARTAHYTREGWYVVTRFKNNRLTATHLWANHGCLMSGTRRTAPMDLVSSVMREMLTAEDAAQAAGEIYRGDRCVVFEDAETTRESFREELAIYGMGESL